MSHRALVYVGDDYPEAWGWYCLDCPDARKGYATEETATRSARRHEAPQASPGCLIDSRPGAARVDESAIERRMNGDRTFRLRRGEAAEVVRRLMADGWSQNRIEQHTGLNAHRYITRNEAAA